MCKKLLVIILIVLLGVAFSACEREGTAERAGEKIDQSLEKAGDKVKDIGDAIEKKTD